MRPRQEPDGGFDGFDRLEVGPRRGFGLPADDPPVVGVGPAQPLEERGRLGRPSTGRVKHEAAVIADRPDDAESGKDREVHAPRSGSNDWGRLDQGRIRLRLQLVVPQRRPARPACQPLAGHRHVPGRVDRACSSVNGLRDRVGSHFAGIGRGLSRVSGHDDGPPNRRVDSDSSSAGNSDGAHSPRRLSILASTFTSHLIVPGVEACGPGARIALAAAGS